MKDSDERVCEKHKSYRSSSVVTMNKLKPVYTTLFVSTVVVTCGFLLGQNNAGASGCRNMPFSSECGAGTDLSPNTRTTGIMRIAGLSRASLNARRPNLATRRPAVLRPATRVPEKRAQPRPLPPLLQTPFAVRLLKHARRRAYAARLTGRIKARLAPVLASERRALRLRRRAQILAARKHAAVLRRFSTRSAQWRTRRLSPLGPAKAVARAQEEELRANILCQTDSLSPENFAALDGFAARSLGRATAKGKSARQNGDKNEDKTARLRLASLKLDLLPDRFTPSPLNPDATAPETTEDGADFSSRDATDEAPVMGWISTARLPGTSLLRTPVGIRELKLRENGFPSQPRHAALRHTIVDEALQAPEIIVKPSPHASAPRGLRRRHRLRRPLLKLHPRIHKLRPMTKRRTAPRRWMRVQGANTRCFPGRLKKLLRKISAHYGKPVIVISGYRSPSHNRRVGGARRSQHMRCTAADFRVPGVSKFALARYAKSLPGRGGVGTYCRSGFIHLDVGPRRSWHWSCGRRGKRRIAKRRRYRKKYTLRRRATRRISKRRRIARARSRAKG